MKKLACLMTIITMICLSGTIGCEGPAGSGGPQGPEGPQGEQGPEGPQGETGPGARVVNLTLTDFVDEAKMEVPFTFSSPEPDTGAYIWSAVFDTTMNSVAVADTEFVLTYVKLPGNGFHQLPLHAEYTSQGLTTINEQLDHFSVLNQEFFIPESSTIPAQSLGDSTIRYFAGVLGPTDGYFAIKTTNNNSNVFAHTLITSDHGLASSTEYEQLLVNVGTDAAFPLDSDISNASVETYPTTDNTGALLYDISTDQVNAIKDSVGSELNFDLTTWGIVNSTDNSDVSSLSLQENPISRTVEVSSVWGADSIKVSGFMQGINYGNDATAYINTFPLQIRVVIVSGNSVGTKSKSSGKSMRIPYEQVEPLIN